VATDTHIFKGKNPPGDGPQATDVPPIDKTTLPKSRFGRTLKKPQRYESSAANVRVPPVQIHCQHPSPSSPTPLVELEAFKTREDQFGRFRIYRKRPVSEIQNVPPPDHNDFAETEEIYKPRPGNIASGLQMPVLLTQGLENLLTLFANMSVVLLIQWLYSGTGRKSIADTQDLVENVILHKDFKAEDLEGVNVARELKKLDSWESSLEGQGWKKGSVKIAVPCPKLKVAESKAAEFEVEGLLYRDLTAIIKSACEDDRTSESFHATPFQEMWKPSDHAPPIRLYGEAYTSDEMIEAYEEVQKVAPDPEHPNVENVVVELCPYSDATMLAQFGTAFLWPVYIFFGNLSKYIRCQPSSNAAHHTAYFPSVRFIYWLNPRQSHQI
jgi:hypothetical protein